jgi:hypothetical protein
MIPKLAAFNEIYTNHVLKAWHNLIAGQSLIKHIFGCIVLSKSCRGLTLKRRSEIHDHCIHHRGLRQQMLTRCHWTSIQYH